MSRRPAAAGAISGVHAQVGQRVAEFRASQGWSLAKMAEELGFGRATVADVERGLQDLSLSRVMRVAQVLGVSLEALVATPNGSGGVRR